MTTTQEVEAALLRADIYAKIPAAGRIQAATDAVILAAEVRRLQPVTVPDEPAAPLQELAAQETAAAVEFKSAPARRGRPPKQ